MVSSLAGVLSLPTTGAVKVVGIGYRWKSVVAVQNAGQNLYVYISRFRSFATFGIQRRVGVFSISTIDAELCFKP